MTLQHLKTLQSTFVNQAWIISFLHIQNFPLTTWGESPLSLKIISFSFLMLRWEQHKRMEYFNQNIRTFLPFWLMVLWLLFSFLAAEKKFYGPLQWQAFLVNYSTYSSHTLPDDNFLLTLLSRNDNIALPALPIDKSQSSISKSNFGLQN